MHMKISLIIIFAALLLLLSSCKNNNSSITADSTTTEIAGEIAGMKSTVISYTMEMQAEGVKSVTLATQWIDIKNDRFASEMTTETEMMGSKTKSSTIIISADGWEYILNPDTKTGMKIKSGKADEDDPFENIKPEDEQTFRQMIEKEGGKIVGNEDFLGKNCIIVEMIIEEQTTRMWYYKGIPLKISNPEQSMEATKFEENVSIPDNVFSVPAEYKISEMPDMD